MIEDTPTTEAKDSKYHGHPDSCPELNEVHFRTIPINKWQHLLMGYEDKIIVINATTIGWYKMNW